MSGQNKDQQENSMGDDIRIENYKKSVTKILDAWGKEAEKVGKELAPSRRNSISWKRPALQRRTTKSGWKS